MGIGNILIVIASFHMCGMFLLQFGMNRMFDEFKCKTRSFAILESKSENFLVLKISGASESKTNKFKVFCNLNWSNSYRCVIFFKFFGAFKTKLIFSIFYNAESRKQNSPFILKFNAKNNVLLIWNRELKTKNRLLLRVPKPLKLYSPLRPKYIQKIQKLAKYPNFFNVHIVRAIAF